MAVRIDYESVVVRAAGSNPKGVAGVAAGSPRRPGALESRGVRVIRGGCDRYVRIVTTAAMVAIAPRDDHRGNPSRHLPGDPAGGGGGADGGVWTGCVKVIIPGHTDGVDSPGPFFPNSAYGMPAHGFATDIPISRPA